MYQDAIPTVTSTLEALETLDLLELPSQRRLWNLYERRSLELHPAHGKDTKEQFVQLHVAFEYLIMEEFGKYCSNKNGRFYEVDDDWSNKWQERATKRAEAWAALDIKTFEKAQYSQASDNEMVMGLLFFCIGLIIVFGSPIMGYIVLGWKGVIAAAVFLLFSMPFTAQALFRNKKRASFRYLAKSLKRIASSKPVIYLFVLAANVSVFLAIGMNTLLEFWVLVALYVGAIVAAIGYGNLSNMKVVKALQLFPSAISLLFILNFVFSRNPVKETYSFEHREEWFSSRSGGSWQKVGYIYLDGDAYEEYRGMRTFFEFEHLRNASSITYTLETGLLGPRVVKGVKFGGRLE